MISPNPGIGRSVFVRPNQRFYALRASNLEGKICWWTSVILMGILLIIVAHVTTSTGQAMLPYKGKVCIPYRGMSPTVSNHEHALWLGHEKPHVVVLGCHCRDSMTQPWVGNVMIT